MNSVRHSVHLTTLDPIDSILVAYFKALEQSPYDATDRILVLPKIEMCVLNTYLPRLSDALDSTLCGLHKISPFPVSAFNFLVQRGKVTN
jgi:hypothetical protein